MAKSKSLASRNKQRALSTARHSANSGNSANSNDASSAAPPPAGAKKTAPKRAFSREDSVNNALPKDITAGMETRQVDLEKEASKLHDVLRTHKQKLAETRPGMVLSGEMPIDLVPLLPEVCGAWSCWPCLC